MATAQSLGASESSERLNYGKNAFVFITCFISLTSKSSWVYWITFSGIVSHKTYWTLLLHLCFGGWRMQENA